MAAVFTNHRWNRSLNVPPDGGDRGPDLGRWKVDIAGNEEKRMFGGKNVADVDSGGLTSAESQEQHGLSNALLSGFFVFRSFNTFVPVLRVFLMSCSCTV